MAEFEVVRVEPVIRLSLTVEEAQAVRKVLGRHDSSAVEGENTWPVYAAIGDALRGL
jgi:hypothetical protein